MISHSGKMPDRQLRAGWRKQTYLGGFSSRPHSPPSPNLHEARLHNGKSGIEEGKMCRAERILPFYQL